jgi:hypothetical protein
VSGELPPAGFFLCPPPGWTQPILRVCHPRIVLSHTARWEPLCWLCPCTQHFPLPREGKYQVVKGRLYPVCPAGLEGHCANIRIRRCDIIASRLLLVDEFLGRLVYAGPFAQSFRTCLGSRYPLLPAGKAAAFCSIHAQQEIFGCIASRRLGVCFPFCRLHTPSLWAILSRSLF